MPETQGKLYKIFNNVIITFLVIQIITVSTSIAVSSVSFGIWGGLWIIQLLFFRKEPGAKAISREMKFIVLFLFLYSMFELITRIFAVYPEGALTGLKRLLLFLIFFVSVFKIFDRKSLYLILFLILCSVMLVSVYELIVYITSAPEKFSEIGFSETRIGYFSYPLTTGEIKMLVILSMLPLMFIKEPFFVKQKYLIMIASPVILTMILTQSRNVFLAMLVCLIIFSLIKNWKALIVGVIVGVILLFILPSEITSRFMSIFDPSHPSNEARLKMWETGWKIFLANPLIGVGDNKIMEVYSQFKFPLESTEHSHLHSNFFMILVTTGILGFIAYAGFFISIFLKQLKYYKEITNESDHALILGSILMFIGFHIAGIFEWSFGDHEVLTVFLFLISVPFVIFKIFAEKKVTH